MLILLLFIYFLPLAASILLTVLLFNSNGFFSTWQIIVFLILLPSSFVPVMNIIVALSLLVICLCNDAVMYKVSNFFDNLDSKNEKFIQRMNKVVQYDEDKY